jgi:hypothetical protein
MSEKRIVPGHAAAGAPVDVSPMTGPHRSGLVTAKQSVDLGDGHEEEI